MAFRFGTSSLAHLNHVHPTLAEITTAAIGVSSQDFSVTEGCRSLTQEKLNVAAGVSRTLNSQHLIQPDGFAHAVDLVPYVDGRTQWLWDHIYPIVRAMKQACLDKHFDPRKIRWGGVWDRRLDTLDTTSDESIAKAVHDYTVRHKGSDLLDGPHFELRL